MTIRADFAAFLKLKEVKKQNVIDSIVADVVCSNNSSVTPGISLLKRLKQMTF